MTLGYEPRYDAHSARLELFRIVQRGEARVEEIPVWSRTYAHRRHAEAILGWMTSQPERWPLWGRLSELVGPERLLTMAVAQVADERSEAARKLLRSRAQARKAGKRSRSINSYLVEKDGEFGVDLRRAGHENGFFAIFFRQSWERERFRDWWRPQAHRFAEFAAFLDEHGAPALERRLLREMQETEKRVKLAGLSAGGRRPLRFWRGDE
jgi:hypothetical protein